MRALMAAQLVAPLFALLVPLPVLAAFPPPPGATEAQLADPANWPSDPQWATASHAHLLSFDPAGGGAAPGVRADAAFATTRGDPRVVIAVLSTGVRWDERDLVTRFALNRGEVPVPQRADGSEKPPGPDGEDAWDLNEDGRFDVRDYAEDPRLTGRDDAGDANGNGFLDPQDLLRVFANGADDDGNGRIDDVCGWDFVDGDADAEEASSFGTRYALLAAAEVNNGIGGAGACPDCAILPLRVSADAQRALRLSPFVLAQSLRTAGELQATVAIFPGAVTQQTPAVDEVLALARLLLVTPSRAPSASLTSEPFAPHPSVLQVACSANASAWTDALAPSPQCAEDAAAVAGGVAGLVRSASLMASANEEPEALLHLVRAGGVGVRLDAREAVARAAAGVQPHLFGSEPPPHRRRLEPHVAFELAPFAPGATDFSVARSRAPSAADFIQLEGSSFVPEQVPGLGTTYTVRARAELNGLVSERRWQLVAHERHFTPTGWPLPNVANTPRVVDVDGDLRDELVFATKDGLVHALDERWLPLPGFPKALSAPGTVKAPIAAVDLDNDGRRDLIVVTLEGSLHALRGVGEGEIFSATIEGGVRAAPVVVSSYLGPLIIVLGDGGLLHVFRSNGDPLPGFPSQLALTEVEHTPAAADLNGDESPEVLAVGRTADGVSRAVLVSVDTSGPQLFGGWPIDVDAAGSPVLGDLAGAGRTQAAFPVRNGAPLVVDLQGLPVVSMAWAPSGASPSTSELALADLRANRRLWLAAAMGDETALWPAGQQLERTPGQPAPVTTARAAWPEGTGAAVGDVDGDGRVDLVHGGGEALCATTRDGLTAEGWPEPLGDALSGTPALGTQSERQVVAARTVDGHLYLLRVAGQPELIQWDGAHHDPGHTGAFSTRLPERLVPGIGIELPEDDEEGCGCSAGASGSPLLFTFTLLLAAFAQRPRRRHIVGASP